MIGEPASLSSEMTCVVSDVVPEDKPRYLMGCGYPEDIIEAVSHGIDLFDCVLPTRNGRTGMAFTSNGKVIIKASRYSTDRRPLDRNCRCYTCRNFSRAYLRHLFNAGEVLAGRLVSYHNIFFYNRLMSDIRKAINNGSFPSFAKKSLAKFNYRDS